MSILDRCLRNLSLELPVFDAAVNDKLKRLLHLFDVLLGHQNVTQGQEPLFSSILSWILSQFCRLDAVSVEVYLANRNVLELHHQFSCVSVFVLEVVPESTLFLLYHRLQSNENFSDGFESLA